MLTAKLDWLESKTQVLTKKNQLLKNFKWSNDLPDLRMLSTEQNKFYAYKYSIGPDCVFRVAKTNIMNDRAFAPRDIHHVRLARANKTYAAGTLYLYDLSNRRKIIVTNESTRFCPDLETTKLVTTLLEQQGWKKTELEVVDLTAFDCKK